MTLTFPMCSRPLKGVVAVPGDKSLAHRAALFAALAEGESVVSNYPDSGVTRSMRGALASLGVDSSLEDGVLRVKGNGFRPFPNRNAVAYCGNSATTIRLLAGAVAGTGSEAVLDGSEGLRKRPMNRIADPLRQMGVEVETNNGCAPLRFRPNRSETARISALEYALPVASAQVLSCLQLAALGAEGESRFIAPGPVRDHTVRMLASMGAPISAHGNESTVSPLGKRALRPLEAALPGDISSAAFLFAAAAMVPSSRVTVTRVGVNPTRTGVLDVLAKMGAGISLANERMEMGEPVADVTLESNGIHGIAIDGDLVVRSIDEFPAIAAVAAFAEGVTEVHGAKELRYKETDRIAAIVAQLRALGVQAEEFDDGFAVVGGTLKGGTARANGDHRLAMSMSLCGLRAPVAVEGAEILNESFPDFEMTMRSLF